ncbi:hypothetical protein MUP37_04830 [Candidatus Bathyarchaeota archaeon]|nr:hypothetical protein [Candidatus Bathyarchaeota archaeon]
MTEIPIPDNYKSSKMNRLSAAEQEKMNRLLEGSLLTQGWLKNKSYEKQCNAKEVSLELQQKYQETVYPVCPVLSKWVNNEEGNRLVVAAQVLEGIQRKFYSTPNLLNLLTWNSIVRILKVFEHLIQLKPDLQTVVKCAHTENLLKGRLDLIRNDLLALPQSLEKDLPDTSKECKELIAELNLAEYGYSLDGQSLVYLLPNHLESGNWATFLQWRERQVNNAKFSDAIEMRHLTRHYPAEAIKVMHTLHDKLSPLVRILLERAAANNQLKAELKQTLDTYLEKPIETGQNVTLKSKIKDFLWTLYEKTLKVIVDAAMERWWPK